MPHVPSGMDEREHLREECHKDLAALRREDVPERVFRLLERIVARLDRLETGSFYPTEAPTEPEVRAAHERRQSGSWKNDGVLAALKGQKPGTSGGDDT